MREMLVRISKGNCGWREWNIVGNFVDSEVVGRGICG